MAVGGRDGSGPAEMASGSPAVEIEEIASCFQRQDTGHLKSVGRPYFGHTCCGQSQSVTNWCYQSVTNCCKLSVTDWCLLSEPLQVSQGAGLQRLYHSVLETQSSECSPVSRLTAASLCCPLQDVPF